MVTEKQRIEFDLVFSKNRVECLMVERKNLLSRFDAIETELTIAGHDIVTLENKLKELEEVQQ